MKYGQEKIGMKEINKKQFKELEIGEQLIMKVKDNHKSFKANVTVDSMPTSTSIAVIIDNFLEKGSNSKVGEDNTISAEREDLFFLPD